MSSLSLLVIVLAGCTLTTTTGMVTPSGGKSLPTTRRQPFVQQQQQQQYGPATTSGTPNAIGTDLKHTVTRNAAVFSAAALAVSSGSSINQPAVAVADSLTLPKNAYTTLGKDGMPMCRILNGMWQLSGGHGFEPQFNKALAEMNHCADTGFTTFDLADHYGPAEDYVGQFSKGKYASSKAKNCQFFTKWVPMPVEMTRRKVEDAVDVSLKRMETDRLDLMQFHWWQYSNPNYFDALGHLTDLKEKGKIRNIGLTNFDTERLAGIIDQNIPIVSNQIAFSLIDTRPLKKMSSYCKEKNIKLLCYGTLMGGFVSKEWLNQPMPARESLNNMSLRKYLPWIMYWGGWDMFQEMLTVLDVIGKKHDVSISNVALRWVLDQPAVGGAIVGVRFGLKEHLADNQRVFNLALDDTDRQAIAAVQAKGKDLSTVFGDSGGEYRTRG